jgi:hypothetical protein
MTTCGKWLSNSTTWVPGIEPRVSGLAAELSHWPGHYHLKPSKFYLPGEVNFTATAEALQSPELCGNKLTEVPALVHKDTVVKSVIVEVCEH